MKKLILMAAVLMISAAASFAQMGARIGMNFASLSNNDMFKSSVGLHLGAVYNMPLGDSPLSFQPGIYYSQRNWKLDDFSIGGISLSPSDNDKVSTHHVELPILVKYNFDISDILSIDPHVGPYFDWGVGGKLKDSDWKIYDKDYADFDRMDMGVVFGCGAYIYEKVYAGIDFLFGFKEIGKGTDNKSIHNHNVMITFGVNFGD